MACAAPGNAAACALIFLQVWAHPRSGHRKLQSPLCPPTCAAPKSFQCLPFGPENNATTAPISQARTSGPHTTHLVLVAAFLRPLSPCCRLALPAVPQQQVQRARQPQQALPALCLERVPPPALPRSCPAWRQARRLVQRWQRPRRPPCPCTAGGRASCARGDWSVCSTITFNLSDVSASWATKPMLSDAAWVCPSAASHNVLVS